jgi:hypothetical protein
MTILWVKRFHGGVWRGVWIGWNERAYYGERIGARTGPHRVGKLAFMFRTPRRLR